VGRLHHSLTVTRELAPMYWLITIICTLVIIGAMALVAGADVLL
jgi:hypothetical protein